MTFSSRSFQRATYAVFLALGALAALPAAAADNGLSISGAWFRFIIPSVPAAGYFTLTNASHEKRVLTGAASPACGMLMMHKSTRANGEDQMIMVMSVDVPADGAVSFAPGGYHLMCMEPAKDMKIGASVPVTLIFADGAKIEQSFPVRGVGGQ